MHIAVKDILLGRFTNAKDVSKYHVTYNYMYVLLIVISGSETLHMGL